MTERLDIRIHVDGLPPLQVATTPTLIGGERLALPLGALWCDATRHAAHDEAVEAAVEGSVENVRRLLRGEGAIAITQAQADELVRQVREGAGRAPESFEVPECIKHPVRQLDMFGRTG